MADEELIATGLEVLEDLAAVLMEEAHERAVSRVPVDAGQRLVQVQALRQVGADIVTLADACEVLIRRGAGEVPSSGIGGVASP